MKSSSIGRSALSRESMDVIENLASQGQVNFEDFSNGSEGDILPNEYVRQENSKSKNVENKAQEIDLLWQNFKSSQFNTNSPLMCVIGGFILGCISTLIVLGCMGFLAHKAIIPARVTNDSIETAQQAENEITNKETENVSAIVEDTENEIQAAEGNSQPQNAKKYVIKNGDTVEGIIKKQYGAYTPERAEAIMKANNLKNLDHISIDQVLYLPLE